MPICEAAYTSEAKTVPSTARLTDSCASGNACARVLDVVRTSQTAWGRSHLIEPAAVEGPNQVPTSLPRALPARAMRWTPNGASGEGVSKNQVRILTYTACSSANMG